jgi:hypothetical protein
MKLLTPLFIFLFTIVCLATYAQDEQEETTKKGFDRSRLFVGGNFGLSFGNFTFINISPQVGYHFTNKLAAGVGINGQYTQYKILNNAGNTYQRQNYGVAGMNLFGRFYPIEQAFLQVQPEMNYVWGKIKAYNPEAVYTLNAKILPSLLVGAGGAIPAGRAGSFVVLAQYDVLNKNPESNNPGTPYGNKIFFSFGFNLGL